MNRRGFLGGIGASILAWVTRKAIEPAHSIIIYLRDTNDGSGLVSFDSGATFIPCEQVELCAGPNAEWQPAEMYMVCGHTQDRKDNSCRDIRWSV